MYYARVSSKKITNFSIFAVMLAVLLLVTFLFMKTLPGEYFTVDGLKQTADRSLQTIEFRLSYDNSSIFSASALNSITQVLFPNSNSYSAVVSSSTATQDVPSLLYHGITKNPDRFSMTQETFKDQMFALKRAGYHTITMEQFYDFMQGKIKLDNKAFLLTFDDGRTDSYTGADPILQALGYTAIMFTATHDSLDSSFGSSYYLHIPLLEKMIKSGRWEIESHLIQDTGASTGGLIPVDAQGTMGNFLSNKMWLPSGRLETDQEYQARVVRELKDSKTQLESTFGIKVIAMSYPFGDYGQQNLNNPGAEKVINDVMKTTYTMGFHQVWPSINLYTSNYPDTDLYHLHRVEVGTKWTGAELVGFLDNARTKALPFSSVFSNDYGWKAPWGSVSVHDNGLYLQAFASTTGAFAFLDGTENWDNYMYAVSTKLEEGNHVTLFARWKDRDNNVSCTFSKDGARIDERLKGIQTQIAREKSIVQLPSPQTEIELGIQVNGPIVRCYEGSRVVAYVSNLAPSLHSGGIGVQTWNEVPGVANLTVSSLVAVPADRAIALKDTLPPYHLLPLK